MRQFFIKPAQALLHLALAAGRRAPANLHRRRRLGILVGKLPLQPGEPAERAVRGLEPRRRLGKQKAIGLQIGILPQLLAKNVEGRRQPLMKLPFEALELQSLKADIAARGCRRRS